MHGAPPTLFGEQTDERRLQVYLFGEQPFEVVASLQRRLAYDVAGDRSTAILILCEHDGLISVGREGSYAAIHVEPEELRARRWCIRWVNRGGGCQLHLPGQLNFYAILALDQLGLGLDDYLDLLRDVLASTLAEFSVAGQPRTGHAGLWVGDRPIADLGVAVFDWVTTYGGILNVNPQLDPFRLVTCAAPDALPMTSLERERRGPLRTAMVRERFIEHFAARFGFDTIAMFFDHPALGRKALPDAVASHR